MNEDDVLDRIIVLFLCGLAFTIAAIIFNCIVGVSDAIIILIIMAVFAIIIVIVLVIVQINNLNEDVHKLEEKVHELYENR
jgi:cell division protein FtsL